MRKAVEVAKHRFKPESITFLNRAAGERGTVEIGGGCMRYAVARKWGEWEWKGECSIDWATTLVLIGNVFGCGRVGVGRGEFSSSNFKVSNFKKNRVQDSQNDETI